VAVLLNSSVFQIQRIASCNEMEGVVSIETREFTNSDKHSLSYSSTREEYICLNYFMIGVINEEKFAKRIVLFLCGGGVCLCGGGAFYYCNSSHVPITNRREFIVVVPFLLSCSSSHSRPSYPSRIPSSRTCWTTKRTT